MSTRTLVRLGVGALLISGCGKGEKLPTVPVTGTVTYKGAPVAGASVSFISTKEGERPASGTTDSQGNFQLQTYMGGNTMVKGAVPGDYKVVISKRENTTEMYRGNMGGGNPDGGKLLEDAAKQGPPTPSGGPPGRGGPPPDMMRGRAPEGKALIPEKYENVTTSGLTATVKPSDNPPSKFDLVD